MIMLKKYEDVVLLLKDKGNYNIDIGNLDNEDYLKAIDFIYHFKGVFKRITRCKFSFIN